MDKETSIVILMELRRMKFSLVEYALGDVPTGLLALSPPVSTAHSVLNPLHPDFLLNPPCLPGDCSQEPGLRVLALMPA